MTTLNPSAERLAENLFGDEQTTDFVSAYVSTESDSMPEADWRDVIVPDSVRAAIASHVAARRILQAQDLRAGDIVLLGRVGSDGRQLNISVGALLVEKLNDIWRGFVVAGELDYVSQYDVLIEDQDEPIDPAMRFIQAWNSIELVISTASRALGALSPARIAAITEVAKEAKAGHAVSALPPALTRICLRQLASEASIVTGTSIGNQNDPRRHYQALYKALAREASVTAIAQRQPKAYEPRATTKKSWPWPPIFAGLVATVIIGQSLLLVNQADFGAQEKIRSVSQPGTRAGPAGPRLKVLFKPNVNYESIAKAVRDIGAQFVSGPDDNGDVVLSVPVERMQEAATVLRIRELVDSIEMLPEQKDAAK